MSDAAERVRANWDAPRAAAIIHDLQNLEGATLPIMHALQAEFGHVPTDAIPLIAEALNLSRAEIHGCLTFYHDFRRTPAGRHVVKLCRAEACQAVGADALHRRLHAQWGTEWHGTTTDGRLTVEPVFCLGLCANGPAAMIDDKPVARIDIRNLDSLVPA